MVDSDQVIQFIRQRGPVIPVDLARHFGKDTIIMGAFLSELVSNRKVLLSHAKIGGTPLYYVPEQVSKLQSLYKYLNEKDQRAYDLLKERKVIRDVEMTPLLRVSLRQIKDFAKPITVKTSQGQEIFWRWYLLSSDEAGNIIKSFFRSKETRTDESASRSDENSKSGEENADSQKAATAKDDVKDKKDDTKDSANGSAKNNSEDNPKGDAKEILKEGEKQDEKQDEKGRASTKQKKNGSNTTDSSKKGLLSAEEEQTKLDSPVVDCDDEMHRKIKKFFNKKEIIVKKLEVVRKNSEIEYILDVPSVVGKIRYFCKAKSKKRVSDADLASAYVQGEINKLPVLFIAFGELTKKAQEMLRNFENLKIVKLG